MITFNETYTRFTDLSRNTATTPVNNDTLGGQLINESEAIVLSMFPFPFLEDTANLTSVASQESYELPVRVKNNQVIAVRFEESSTVIHRAKPINSWEYWEYLQ